MYSNKYFIPLVLPETPLKKEFQLPSFPASAPNSYEIYKPEEILDQQIAPIFKKINLEIKNVALFYKRANSRGAIHTDIFLENNRWKKMVAGVNWNITGADSRMNWYQVDEIEVEPELNPPAELRSKSWYYTLNGLHFGSRGSVDPAKAKAKVLESAYIGGPTLVRTDIPHSVINTDKTKGRWALSIRFAPDFENWNQAISALMPLISK